MNATRAFSVYYIYDTSDNPQGWGGTDRGGYSESMICRRSTIETGKIRLEAQVGRQRHRRACSARPGNLLSLRRRQQQQLRGAARDAPATRSGTPGSAPSVSNGPITYELDGQQYVGMVGAGDTLWAFVMRKRRRHRRSTSAAAAGVSCVVVEKKLGVTEQRP